MTPDTQPDRAAASSPTTSHRSIPTTSRERVDTWWIVGFSAVAGAFAGAEPCGWLPADVVITAAFAALVTLAASRARRWAWVTTSVIALIAAGGDIAWVLLAATALGLAIAAAVLERRSRVWGAVIGAACIQVLLHLPDRWFHGSSAAIVAIAVLPLLLSGYRRARVPERRRIRRVAGATLGVLLLLCAAFGAAAALARPDLEDGADRAELALDLVRDGRTDEASALLDDANDSFARAESLLTGPLALPARLVPVLGYHAAAAGEMARAGTDLTEVGAATTTTARYDDLAFSAGTIDLDRVTRLQNPVHESLVALESAEDRLAGADAAWLVPLVSEPLVRVSGEVSSARSEAALADDALAVAPFLLGAQGPQTYVALLGQPAESRFGGGFIGTWAELQASSGQLTLTDSGTIEELRSAPLAGQRTLSGPDSYLARYGRYFPAYNLQNVAASPDFPTVRQVMTELYPQTGQGPMNGAVYLDPEGVAALLELSGPVDVAGLVAPLTSEDAAAFLSTAIYEQFPDEDQRDAVLQSAIESLFDALTSRDLPGPRTLATTLGPAVRGNHLAFSVGDPEAETFLASIEATGAFPTLDDDDLLAVKIANSAPNKLDTYVERDLEYDVALDPASGEVITTARLTLTNRAPASGLPVEVATNRALVRGDPDAPPAGTAMLTLSLWSPLLMTGADIDGVPTPMELQTEFGLHVYSTQVSIPPGSSVVLETHLTGVLDLPYRLVVDHQPLASDGSLTVRVTGPAGWRPDPSGGMALVDGALETVLTQTEDVVVEPRFARDG